MGDFMSIRLNLVSALTVGLVRPELSNFRLKAKIVTKLIIPLVRQYWIISGDNSATVKCTVSYYPINFQITWIVRWTLGLLYFHRT